ncbi:PP2C family protein-serine/threonine phosphatase [Streptomyces purpurogeneiscleroticus]|uniref:PP2C family protein-serine/threonine phosphatase n=1 Tax=Streptomyces purpurogeneiscleroticus TaxID=68259 RepID=UPI001CBD67BE|nr:PP2C family protein-serine/threonine phosphatase [Streptomyces purpurogeneiscleroticus]MBZ4019563.1 phosphatase [Streptomyces purpurogeneiscleroticus]
MTTPHVPKVAGIEPTLPAPAHTAAPAAPEPRPFAQLAAAHERLAARLSDLTALHDLTGRLARTDTLEAALHEVLRAGAALVGARRGLVTLEPPDGLGPETTVGLGIGPADIGHLETVPRRATPLGRLLDGVRGASGGGGGAGASAGAGADGSTDTDAAIDPGVAPEPGIAAQPPPSGSTGAPTELAQPDLAGDPGLDPRLREVAARLGYAASYAVPLITDPPAEGRERTERAGRPLGAAVWLYDEPAEPSERGRRLLALYRAYATRHVARLIELHRRRHAEQTLRTELLPARLPRAPGVRLAVRHAAGPYGGGDWYDALPLPDGALSLSVGSVTGSGPSAVAAMGRLRASLRAYAVMEGEDPVAVLSDLELLLRLTEPARSATALFAFAEPPVADPLGGPPAHKIVLAGAGHCPPLIIGEHRTEFVETSLSAPLGMLACWEAPSVELEPLPGETLLLYSDGLLYRTGEPVDRAFSRLHAAAAGLPKSVRQDPEALVDHLVRALLPQGLADESSPEDVVVLAVRFEG